MYFSTIYVVLNIRQINESIKLGILDLKQFSLANGLTIKRDCEKAGTLYLIGKMLNNKNFELLYSPNGKPGLKESQGGISISHSHNKLAVIMNETADTGVDIELIRDKVQSIQHKFLNDTEKELANNTTDKLIAFWAAKEALYKVHGLKGLDFKANLFIDHYSEVEIKASIKTAGFNKHYKLANEKIEDYRLVYILNEI